MLRGWGKKCFQYFYLAPPITKCLVARLAFGLMDLGTVGYVPLVKFILDFELGQARCIRFFFYLNLITFWFIIQLNLGITMPYNCCKGIPRLHHSSTHNGSNEALPHFTIALHTLEQKTPPHFTTALHTLARIPPHLRHILLYIVYIANKGKR